MNNKNLPILIIVLVLVAAVIGGIALYRNQTPSKPANTDTNQAKKSADDFKAFLDKAPPGAQPLRFKGDPNAAVTIEEFADLACPTCAGFHQVLKEIEKSYGQKVKVIFRHFPLTKVRGHENAYNAARAAEAAGIQGRFWEMQNMLFTNQKTWQPMSEGEARSTFEGYAKSIGIDVETFKQDAVGQVASARVGDDMKRADAIKVSATPTVILNGRQLTSEVSDIAALRQLIESELQKAQAPAPSNSTNSANSNAAGSVANQNANK
jgi:protein-disulfide isomerase